MKHFKKGLSRQTIIDISNDKKEPAWMLDIRLAAFEQFLKMPLPNFGPDLSSIDFDSISYYDSPLDSPASRWQDVPNNIKKTYDELGLPMAEQKYLAGLGAQYNSGVVYQRLRDQWTKQGVVFLDTDTGLQQYPDLFRDYFGKLVPASDNKFAALNTAAWSGGSFIYVPPGVKLDIPLQAYFRINIANLGQFERTLIIVDEGASLQYIEGCTAPIHSTNLLHSAVVEVFVKSNARMRYTTIQNWSTNVINLTTERMIVDNDAIGEWIDGNIGSAITMKYPSVILSGENAHGEILSLALAGQGQNQDNGGKAIHLAPMTTSQIISKSISRDSGVATFRGKIKITEKAKNAKSSTKCDALLMDGASVSNTYPLNDISTNDAQIAHEATVSDINQTQLFYLMSRGLSEDEATALLIGGFIEPIVRNLPMEYAVELNRLIDMNMEGAIG